jgi:tRNA pseudouridine38-40 synthase
MTTIQGTLEEAVARIVGQRIHVMGAGRTDSGVHALGQVASLRAEFSHPPDTLRRALTSVLPPDIVVTAVEEMDNDFHAQRCARWKRYRYTLLTRPCPSAIERRYTLFVPYPIKIDAMTEAARTLIGTHDFSAFQAAHSSIESSVRTVLVAEFRQEGDHLTFDIVADGFLRHMIRIIMGTLLDVGRGRLRPEDLKVILEGKDRSLASKTISPHALCMLEVGYQPFGVHLENAPTDLS